MAWWLEGAIFRHFGWVRNPSEAIFCIPVKIDFFRGKNRFLSEKIGDFSPIFFFSDFSTAKSFPGSLKSDFSPKNRSISMIFLSLPLPGIMVCWALGLEHFALMGIRLRHFALVGSWHWFLGVTSSLKLKLIFITQLME